MRVDRCVGGVAEEVEVAAVEHLVDVGQIPAGDAKGFSSGRWGLRSRRARRGSRRRWDAGRNSATAFGVGPNGECGIGLGQVRSLRVQHFELADRNAVGNGLLDEQTDLFAETGAEVSVFSAPNRSPRAHSTHAKPSHASMR